MKPYELLAHTADTGLRIYGQDLEELFKHAALGLFDLITDVQKIREEPAEHLTEIQFHLKGGDRGELLLSWLRELLYVFSTQSLIFVEFSVDTLSDQELQISAGGHFFDPKKHDQKSEVKAVTYHQFKLEETQDGFVAEVIFDI